MNRAMTIGIIVSLLTVGCRSIAAEMSKVTDALTLRTDAKRDLTALPSLIIRVDVAEVTRQRFMEGLTVDRIEIGTEELESVEGQMRNVSTITIHLKK